MKKYTPNLDDPRVRTKIKHAIGFATSYLSNKPRVLTEKKNKDSTADKRLTITAAFGQAQDNLPKWLRTMLLKVSDSHYFFGNGGQSRSYVLNNWGVEKLIDILNTPTKKFNEHVAADELMIATLTKDFEEEMRTKKFQYTQKASARLWHPLQNLQKEKAAKVWDHFGLPHDYDVKGCAPTLIKQHALECGMQVTTPALDAFLADSRGFREYLECYSGVSYDQAKTIINALFCGASLEASPKKSIFRLLEFNGNKLNKIKNDPVIKQLQCDIHNCWVYIKPAGATSKEKWHIYFNLERKVLDAVRGFLDASSVDHFCIHDGFRTSVSVDTCALSAHVLSVTGYVVEFSSSRPVASGLHEPVITILHGSSQSSSSRILSSSYSSATLRAPNSMGSLNDTLLADCDIEDEYEPHEES